MEQIKLSNGNQYGLAVNGVVESGEKLQITILADGWNFADVEKDFDKETNVDRIEVIDSIGEIMDAKRGYTCLESIKKQKDYVISVIQQGELTTTDDGEVLTEPYYENVYGTVYIVSLAKPDLRKQVANLQETVDTLILNALGA